MNVDAGLVMAAAVRLRPHVRRTDLEPSAVLSVGTESEVAVKAEHAQHTGSFKFRGALNRIAALSDDERDRGIVTASSGNHGAGVARAAQLLGCRATVVVPRGASPSKLANIRQYASADVVVVDDTDALEAEVHARRLAGERGATYVSPYNDALVVAGQGTIGMEITDQVADLGWDGFEAVVVSVGGGGLIGGIGTWMRARHPGVTVVGAQPEVDAAMATSISAGRVVDVDAGTTLSDGTAGNLEHDTITFDICRRVVDEWALVPEDDIAGMIATMIDAHHVLVEGAAAVALVAAQRWAQAHPGSRVVAVSCGANISSARLSEVLARAAR